MIISIPKETNPIERRVAVVPATVQKLVTLGFEVSVESGAGTLIDYSDEIYAQSGATIVYDHKELLRDADIILRIQKPSLEEIELFKRGVIHISFLDPYNEKELVKKMASARVQSISMEMIPRTTKAQKMDALSSQANLAGYSSVIVAAEKLNKAFPMMMTPAGTINPARVFIIGVGVAGLQAIATAKRLGARVEAFDTRPVVEEQVKSLGAKFVKIDLGETGQTKDGYAKELTTEQLEKQKQAMAKICSNSDVIITTAQLFGRKAPVLVTQEMIQQMKPGSVIVDMAVETGGNVEGSVEGKEINVNGVHILGIQNLPGNVAVHASQVYSNNLYHFIEEFSNVEKREFYLDRNNEIIQGCLLTQEGSIIHKHIQSIWEK